MAFVVIQGLVMASVASGPVLESIDVEPVWAGHPVGFCLYTCKDLQFVAHYDAERWETLWRSGDQPRKEPIPPPSMLTVFKVQGEHAPKEDEEW